MAFGLLWMPMDEGDNILPPPCHTEQLHTSA